ncbi:MAG TPA: tetratricopeptide repeat protein, partial [Alphaproteobacteria bacterium]|nr:tetratricopeptide repeat protein [Alphaproteobacteria bacterium]
KIGVAYELGLGVEKDEKAAREWFEKAAKNGDEVALRTIGAIDKNEKIKKEAMDSIIKSNEKIEELTAEIINACTDHANKGEVNWQFSLGLAYIQGFIQMKESRIEIEKDIRKGEEWLLKAARQGYAEAQYELGVYYYKGEEVPQDKKEGIKWFQKAADQGIAEAQFNLGCAYNNGDGVPQNKREAVKWFQKAAEQGGADAQFNLGCYYDIGDGVPQDKREAEKWYRMAAEQGHENAKTNLRILQELRVLKAKKEKLIREHAEENFEDIHKFVASKDPEPTTRAHQAKKRELMAADPSGRRYEAWLDSLYDWICPKCKQWSQVYHTYRNTFPYNATNRERIFLDEPPAYVCYKCIYKMKRGGYTGPNIIKSTHE